MLGGINITGAGAIGTAGGTAASQMRASATSTPALPMATGGVAGSLATLAYTTANNPTLPVIPTVRLGGALRNSGLFPPISSGQSAVHDATYNTNLGHSNYQSMEVQTTFRPIRVSAGRVLPSARIWERRGIHQSGMGMSTDTN